MLRIVIDAWILWRGFFCHSLTWPTLIGFSYTALGELQLLFQIPPALLPGSQFYRLLVSIQAMEPDKGADPRVRGILWAALIVMGLAAVLILWFGWQGILSTVGNLALLILVPVSVVIGVVVRAVIYVWNLPIWIIFPMAGWTLVYESYQTIKAPGPTPVNWYVKTAILLIVVLLVLLTFHEGWFFGLKLAPIKAQPWP